MIRKSKHVRVLKRKDDEYLAYHSLFGNLRTLNESAVTLLNQFEEPKAEHLLANHGSYNGLVDTLREIYFLTDEKTDEREIIRDELARRKENLKQGAYIGGLQLSISDACNFNCIYCFADATDKRSPERRRASRTKIKLMSFETAATIIDKVIEVVKKNGGDSLVIKFFGREPMLNWKTIEKIVECYRRGEGKGLTIHYSITSNGSFITEEVAKIMKENNFQVTISIDGVDKTNDTNRPLRNGGASFNLIDASIRNLYARKLNFDFSAVISDKNFDAFGTDFVDYAEKFGVKEIKVLFAMQGDYLTNKSPEEIVDKVAKIYRYGKAKSIAVTGYWYNPFSQLVTSSKTTSQEHVVRTVQDSCAATGFQLSVEPSGDIFPCRAMSTYLSHISQLDDMLLSDEYEKVVLRTYSNVPDCAGCEIEGLCQGECLGNLEELFGDIYTVDKRFCEIYRGLTRRLLLL